MSDQPVRQEPTPGPWHFSAGETNCGCLDAVGGVIGGGYALATVWADVPEIEQQARANALLMAAAPELRDALKEADASLTSLIESGDFAMPDSTSFQLSCIRDDIRAALQHTEGTTP